MVLHINNAFCGLTCTYFDSLRYNLLCTYSICNKHASQCSTPHLFVGNIIVDVVQLFPSNLYQFTSVSRNVWKTTMQTWPPKLLTSPRPGSHWFFAHATWSYGADADAGGDFFGWMSWIFWKNRKTLNSWVFRTYSVLGRGSGTLHLIVQIL